jgi:hypothetical protein
MKWARPTGSSRSSRKLKPHRSTLSFVGAATLGKEGWRQGTGWDADPNTSPQVGNTLAVSRSCPGLTWVHSWPSR